MYMRTMPKINRITTNSSTILGQKKIILLLHIYSYLDDIFRRKVSLLCQAVREKCLLEYPI